MRNIKNRMLVSRGENLDKEREVLAEGRKSG
jgi:hypothetical protein